MSNYTEKLNEAKRNNFIKPFLSDFEGAAYTGLGRTSFRAFAKKINCRRKIGRRVVNDRAVIDQALKRGEET